MALAIGAIVMFAAVGMFLFVKATKLVDTATHCEACGSELTDTNGPCAITCPNCDAIQSWGEDTVRNAQENSDHHSALNQEHYAA